MTTPIVVDAILFDSDGVLVDSHDQVDRAWHAVAERFGLDIGELRASLAGVPARDTLARHLDGERLDEAVAHLEDLEVETASTTVAVRGATALTAVLPDQAFAIVTSATLRLGSARWAAAGITVPRHVVTADDVTVGKPDPQPFLMAADRLGVDPKRCLVFEDSDAGGTAATAAGSIVVAVGGARWTAPCSARVADLAGVTVERRGRRVAVSLADDIGTGTGGPDVRRPV